MPEDLLQEPQGATGETPEAKPEEELSEQDKMMAKLKEALAVTKELVGPLRYRMNISIPRTLLDERMSEQLKEFQREAAVPGFRRGRAPMVLVEKRFAPELSEQIVNQFLGSSFMAAVEREKLDALGDPLILLNIEEDRLDDTGVTRRAKVDRLVKVEEALERMKLPKEGPLEYTCEVEVRPDFELPELENIPIKLPKLAVKDEDVEAELKRSLMRFGTFEPVESGGIELDDLLYADVRIRVGDEVLESLENFDLPARGTVVKGLPLPTLGDVIRGKTRGDAVTVETTIPDDHDRTELRGKPATFDITVREIKRLRVPELDDERAKEWGFDSAAEVRPSVRKRMEDEIEEARSLSRRKQVEDYLLEKVPMELPEALSQRQTERVLARRMIELYSMGFPEVEIGRRLDQLRLKAHDQAIRDLKVSFVMEKIGEKWEVEVSEEEINGAIADMAARQNRRFDRVRDDLSRNDGIYTLWLHLRDVKIADRLLEKAQIVEESE
ncbi:MAG: trigger factor [Phycisphaerales bacterium]|nr:trigger factor [Phycisphaerales bacterium]